MAVLPIIFTHYGVSDYLWRTLKCATVTNPAAERIFIGNSTNRHIAMKCGWRFVDGDKITSGLRRDFLKHFQPIAGPLHTNEKNGRSWLRYVTERWFIIEAFASSEGLPDFWHFNSDTMILEDLSPFAEELARRGVSHTTQSNECAMNGYVTTKAATDFCRFLVSIYRDADKQEELQGWKDRLNTIEPTGGFTEMVSYLWFARDMNCAGPHLESAFDGWWFDDCICQDDGFEMARMNFVGRFIKRIDFDGYGFYGTRGGERRRFATLNCSWVNVTLSSFFLRCVERRAMGLRGEKSVATEWLGLSHFVKAGGRRVLLGAGIIRK